MNLTLTAVAQSGLNWPRFPFPGLRPFQITAQADESLIFYGRNAHKDDVLERLDTSHLVSVVGPSGCGKSSLVKVGVIPALEAGLLTRAGYAWRTVQMRPGSDPLKALAAALTSIGGEYDPSLGEPEQQVLRELESGRSALWILMEHLASTLAASGTSQKACRVLLLIDQFEEIFSGVVEQSAVDKFVGLIAQFFRRPHPSLYIVLTMRTDFISQCANFPGLAEILNRTQYITPVLRGDDLREAIARPVEAYHGLIEPELVSEIVRDMGTGSNYDADNLPLMQHALLWLWRQSWERIGVAASPTPADRWDHDQPKACLTAAVYREHGGLPGILRRHADDVLERVRAQGAEALRIAEVMFRRLSERDASLRYKRAPALASEVRLLAGCSLEELNDVIDPFAGIDASFVERRPRKDPDDPLLDLSHESLIRQWETLRSWADTEADKVATFRRIAGEADSWNRHRRSPAFLKTGGYLAVMDMWWEEHQPTPAWARRYQLADGAHRNLADSFAPVQEFRSESDKAHRKAKMWRRLRYIAAAGLPLITILCFFFAERSRFEEAARSRALLLISSGNRVLDRRSQALAAAIAMELLDAKKGFHRVDETPAFAHKVLGQLRERFEIPVDAPFPSADYSGDGKWLITVDKGRLALVSAGAGTMIPIESDQWKRENAPGVAPDPANDKTAVKFVRWSPSGNSIAVTTVDRSAFLIKGIDPNDPQRSLETITPIQLGGDNRVNFALFSGDGTTVATIGSGGEVRFWDGQTGAPIRAQIEQSQAFGQNGFALSSDGRRVAVQHNNEIDIFDVNDDAVSSAVKKCAGSGPHDQQMSALAFHPKNPDVLLVMRGGEPSVCDLSQDTAVRLTGDPLALRNANRTRQGAFSPDGTVIGTGSDDGLVRLWSFDTKQWMATLREHTNMITSLRFSPDAGHLATASTDKSIRLWTLTPPADPGPVSDAELIAVLRQHLPMRDGASVELTDPLRCEYGILPPTAPPCAQSDTPAPKS